MSERHRRLNWIFRRACRGEAVAARDVVDEFGCTRRTAQRDIQELCERWHLTVFDVDGVPHVEIPEDGLPIRPELTRSP